MLAAGIRTPVPLEELEIHLREEIERQVKSGQNEQQAFEIAARQIGHADELQNEFGKNCWAKRTAKWSLLWTGCVGLTITLILNLLGRFVFHRNSSIYFSSDWWAGWFPNYIIWTIFIIAGLVVGFSNRKIRFRLKLQFKTTKH
ncbi:MAG TPA: hypothetical protein VGH42_04440 [Verrucomicrobiae bacterium]